MAQHTLSHKTELLPLTSESNWHASSSRYIRFSPAVCLARYRYPEHVAWTRERRVACWDLVENPEGKRALGKSRSRWEDNIKMSLGETGWGPGLD